MPPRPLTRRLLTRVLALAAVSAPVGCSDSDGQEGQPEVLEPQDGQLEALTYNVAGLPQGLSGSNPEVNIPLISPLLNAYQLVLVQEDFVYHDALAAEAVHPYQSIPKEHYLKLVHDGLNRFSEFPWSIFERIQWVACYGDATSGASDCLAEKGFSLARTEFGRGVYIDVYNHHAEAGGGAEDEQAREAGYEQLIDYIQQHSAGRVVIVAGDTNLHGDDPVDLALLERFKQETGLQDVCELLSCGGDRIDRFFIRSNELIAVEPIGWEVAGEFVDEQGADLSDHKAVHVTLSWRTR